MRDRRDYVIVALAAALLFCLGLFVGAESSVLPAAVAQDGSSFDPETPVAGPPAGGGITISSGPPLIRPGLEGRTRAETASDSNSNNRFIAVTAPIGSGESVLYLIDSKTEQLVVYRFGRNRGLMFLAGRKIQYDLKISGYRDVSEFSHLEMKELYGKQRAKEAAAAAKSRK